VTSCQLPVAESFWQLATINPSLRDQEIARADSGHFVSIAEKRASRFINADPRSAYGPIADDAGNAIARFVDGQRAPLRENGVAIEGPSESIVEMLDECLRRRGNAAEIAWRNFADGDGVRATLVSERLDIDPDAD